MAPGALARRGAPRCAPELSSNRALRYALGVVKARSLVAAALLGSLATLSGACERRASIAALEDANASANPNASANANANAKPSCDDVRRKLETAVRDAKRQSPDALVAVHLTRCPPFLLSVGASKLDVSRPFRMASVAKTTVATLALRAVERGVLSLDAPLERHEAFVARYPDLRKTTLRSLLRHTSGLFPYEKDPTFLAWQKEPPSLRKPDELLARALAHALPSGPRAHTNAPWTYANTNYVAVALLLESVARLPLSTQIQNEILLPEGLAHTHPERGAEDLVPSFDAEGREKTRAHHPSWLFGAGDLVTNLEDLVRWTRRYGTGAVIPASLRTEWLRTTPTDDESVSYGLGVFVTNGDASGGLGEARSHAGDVAGLHLEAVYFVALDAAVVAVTNRDGGDPEALVLAAARAVEAP